jgi:hypothetical protein
VVAQNQEESLPGGVARNRLRAIEAFVNLPLYFETNQGQSEAHVKFFSRGTGDILFLTSSKAVLVLTKREPEDTESWKTERRTSGTVLSMAFVGANRQPRVSGRERLPGKVNYFIGNDPRKWRTNIATYLRNIVLGFSGAERVEVDARGDLLVHTDLGVIRQRKPVVYQEIKGVRREISGGYLLKDKHKVGFQVAGAAPVYSTYFRTGKPHP